MRILIGGAGIGGLTAALSLAAAGFRDVRLLEAAPAIREIGVGVNLPPHAVRELVELGLGDGLAAIGHPTASLSYYDRNGKLIWAEPRGLGAGYRWPQYSVHRGRLQQLLYRAVQDRLGADAVCTGQRITGLTRHADRIEVTTATAAAAASVAHATHAAGAANDRHQAELLIGADGIRSAVRTALYGRALPLASNGWIMYRGAAPFPAYLDGRTMVIIGDEHQRIVVYPIDGRTLNWLMVRPARPAQATETGHAADAELGNWNRPVDPQRIAGEMAGWRFDWLDIPALIAASPDAWVYPMADIDPLPRWTFDRVTLLGDAAHAMYPFGSNGASQAVLDARVLAWHLARGRDPLQALQAYDASRREAVGAVQLANRRQASEVMARVGALSRADAHHEAGGELKDIEAGYKKIAGFDVETLNTRPSWSVDPPRRPAASSSA